MTIYVPFVPRIMTRCINNSSKKSDFHILHVSRTQKVIKDVIDLLRTDIPMLVGLIIKRSFSFNGSFSISRRKYSVGLLNMIQRVADPNMEVYKNHEMLGYSTVFKNKGIGAMWKC